MRFVSIFLLLAIASTIFAVGQHGMTCSQSEPSSLEIDFALPQWDLIDAPDKDGSIIQSSNLAWIAEEGKPQLPIFSTSIALPDRGSFHYEVEILEEEIVNDVLIAPWHEPTNEAFVDYDGSIYGQDKLFPESIVEMSDPAIMRDYRVAAITVTPFRYNDANKQLHVVRSFRLHVQFNENRAGINEITSRNRSVSTSFTSLYSNTLLNYDQVAQRTIDDPPCILFIHYNNTTIAEYVSVLAGWKHQVGYEVHQASTSQTGTSTTSIKNYIQNAYDNWSNPPDYVILVGDASGSYSIPTWYHSWSARYTAEGDHPYTLLDGNDEIEDVYIGRLSFGNLDQLMVIASKIYNYESNPYMGDTEWYDQVLLVGDTSPSGISCISTNKYVKELMSNENPSYSFTELYGSQPSPNEMDNVLNNGVGFFNYRGWWGMSDWDDGTHADNLSNTNMLPVCVIITCDTGTFGNGTSVTEELLRSGTTLYPRGGICAIGSATTGTHTAYNNALDAGIFSGLFVQDFRTIGEALQYGKFTLWEIYHDSQFETMQFFVHNNNLMGDPSLQIWKSIPLGINASFPSTISPGTDQVTIRATKSSGAALSGAWVTILKGSDTVFSTGYTDINGYVSLPVGTTSTGQVTVTITRPGYQPYTGSFNIGTTSYSVGIDNTIIDDDNSGTSSGNDDGIVNAGESIELKVTLRNNGTSSLSNVTATLSSRDSMVESITDNSESWGTISAGATDTCNDDFDFIVEPGCPDGYELSFTLTVRSGLNSWQKLITIPVTASNMYVGDIEIDDANHHLDPTETADLYLELANDGSLALQNVNATISSTHEEVTFDVASASFGTIGVGASVTNASPFVVSATEDVIPGTQCSMKLTLTADGSYAKSFSFPLTVGTVSVSDPLGPDDHGYYIYDSYDTIYSLVPAYDWIEIDPSYGGSGTSVGLADSGENQDDVVAVDLPITFNLYGKEYNRISICSNGWISGGETEQITFRNYRLPGPLGPHPMVAAFWDDLEMGYSSDVVTYYDPWQHIYIIEWSRMDNMYNGADETFQIILYDASYYSTPTYDSPIKIQYHTFNNVDQGGSTSHGEYCTVGIENNDESIGLEYTFDNEYPTAAHPLSSGMALYITTELGEVQAPPSANVTTSQIELYALQDATAEDQFTIGNNGEAVLSYSIVTEYEETRDSGEDGTFGYSWIDSNEPNGPDFDWIDITGSGTEIDFNSDDQMSSPINIGFDFPFYDDTYSSLQVCSNGFISFNGTGASEWTNISIPLSDDPDNFIAPFYDDLSPQNSGTVHYYRDTALNRFILSFTMVPHYGTSYPGTYSFQAILYRSGKIVFQYEYLSGTINSQTIGIENSNGSDGLLIAYNENYVEEDLAIEISAGIEWLTVSPVGGTVNQDDSQTISLTANSADLELGDYNCSLQISTNDPAHNPIVIPVTLHVVSGFVDPSAVTGLVINANAGATNLSWEPVTTDVNGSPITVSYYKVYRSELSVDVAPEETFYLGFTTDTSYTDNTLDVRGYKYIVTAVLDTGREVRIPQQARKETRR